MSVTDVFYFSFLSVAKCPYIFLFLWQNAHRHSSFCGKMPIYIPFSDFKTSLTFSFLFPTRHQHLSTRHKLHKTSQMTLRGIVGFSPATVVLKRWLSVCLCVERTVKCLRTSTRRRSSTEEMTVKMMLLEICLSRFCGRHCRSCRLPKAFVSPESPQATTDTCGCDRHT